MTNENVLTRFFNWLQSLWRSFQSKGCLIQGLILIFGGFLVWVAWQLLKFLWGWLVYPYIITPLKDLWASWFD